MAANQPAREACYLTRGEQDMIRKALQYYAQEQQTMIGLEWVKQIKPYADKNKPAPEKNRLIFEDHKQHHTKIKAAADALHERFRVGDHRRGGPQEEPRYCTLHGGDTISSTCPDCAAIRQRKESL